MTSRAASGARSACSPRSHYDVIHYRIELATPTVTDDVQTYAAPSFATFNI